MKKTDYTEPTEAWLQGQFKDVPFGIMRPAEIETVLAFFLIYHNGNDIEEDEEKLAFKYRITESKARKLKIEFARRYGAEQDIAVILARLFEKGDAPFELSEDGKSVCFMIRDPYELKRVQEDLRGKKIVYYGDFSRGLVKLSIFNFVRFMAAHYNGLKEPLKKLINEKLDENDEKHKAYWESLSRAKKAEYMKNKYAPAVINGIFSLIGAGASVAGAIKG